VSRMRDVRAALASLALAAALGGCGKGSGPVGAVGDGDLVRGSALVAPGAEGCAVSLLIDGRRYEPAGLPAELQVVGLRLRVEGVARSRPSVCMIGMGLELRSARIE